MGKISIMMAILLLMGCSSSGDYLPPAGTTTTTSFYNLDLTTGTLTPVVESMVATGSSVTLRRLDAGTTPYAPRDEVTDTGISTLLLGSPQVGSYYLARTELTQAQWQTLVGAAGTGNSAPWGSVAWAAPAGSAYPAANLSANEVKTVLAAWNARFPHKLRLPTCAEWENACRAGTSTPWSWGSSEAEVGTYASVRETQNGSSGASPVAGRSANAWGFFDLHGNVWEWVSDGGTGGVPCLRGGSWSDNLLSARSGNRLDLSESTASPLAGVRLVLEVTL